MVVTSIGEGGGHGRVVGNGVVVTIFIRNGEGIGDVSAVLCRKSTVCSMSVRSATTGWQRTWAT